MLVHTRSFLYSWDQPAHAKVVHAVSCIPLRMLSLYALHRTCIHCIWQPSWSVYQHACLCVSLVTMRVQVPACLPACHPCFCVSLVTAHIQVPACLSCQSLCTPSRKACSTACLPAYLSAVQPVHRQAALLLKWLSALHLSTEMLSPLLSPLYLCTEMLSPFYLCTKGPYCIAGEDAGPGDCC